uniref:Uncharacterized protein n=1 Tax=Anguilla anguilla TaxID=7936 RepID=A0A0E9U3C4_ANGAN
MNSATGPSPYIANVLFFNRFDCFQYSGDMSPCPPSSYSE